MPAASSFHCDIQKGLPHTSESCLGMALPSLRVTELEEGWPCPGLLGELLSVTSGYLLLIQRAAPRVYQRGAGGGGSEGSAAEAGHRGIPSDWRDVRQLQEKSTARGRQMEKHLCSKMFGQTASDLTSKNPLWSFKGDLLWSFKRTGLTNILWPACHIRNQDVYREARLAFYTATALLH